MYKFGFLFLFSGLTKFWLSLLFAKSYMLKSLSILGEIEGDLMDQLSGPILNVIIIEFVLAGLCFLIAIFQRTMAQNKM